jgi:hypothetical protein
LLRSFVIAQLDKAEAKRLLECYPSLRDLPAEELEAHLRRLVDEKKEYDRLPMPGAFWYATKNILYSSNFAIYILFLISVYYSLKLVGRRVMTRHAADTRGG